MTVAIGKSSRILANAYAVSGWIRSYTVGHSRALEDSTVISDLGARWTPTLLAGALKLDGNFDSAAGSLAQVADTARTVDDGLLVTVCPDATTIGQPLLTAVANVSGMDVASEAKGLVTVGVEGTPDDGVDWGVSLHAHAAETVTGNGASVDNLASTASGGIAVLHLTDFTGLTSITVKVQHSTNNSTWVDLPGAGFTLASAITSERLAVSGTVNRYLRTAWTAVGTGSATFLVGFARR